MIAEREAAEAFPCFGSSCAAHVIGAGGQGGPEQAVAAARRLLRSWHERFTRFSPSSELSRLNADPRARVPVDPFMGRFVRAVVEAAEQTGGLVDATLLRPLEALGYRADLGAPLPLDVALRLAPRRAPARPSPRQDWRRIRVDAAGTTVTRPPGIGLDSGGLAKGLFADALAAQLETHASFAIDCGGDIRLGGAAGLAREVHVASPFDGSILHTYELAHAGIATSGIGRRSWLDAAGRPAHHVLDPATGRPAFTGLVQVTAIAPTALEAETRAKAALLSGPADGTAWLPDGGIVVFEDGGVDVVAPAAGSAAKQRGSGRRDAVSSTCTG